MLTARLQPQQPVSTHAVPPPEVPTAVPSRLHALAGICDTLFRTRKEDYPKFANKPHPMDKVRNPGKDGKQKKAA